jgi:fumarate hydratase subunit beta
LKSANLRPPLGESDVRKLRAGEIVSVSGKIVTARDNAYARVLSDGKPPIDLRGGIVYHCGPLAKKTGKNWKILSAGPTTSARLDGMQEEFVKLTGVRALIGKGGVSEDVANALARLGCVYLAFTGGAGVVAARAVKNVDKIVWPEFGAAEAMWVLRVEDFGPLVVAVDTRGKNLYSRPKP